MKITNSNILIFQTFLKTRKFKHFKNVFRIKTNDPNIGSLLVSDINTYLDQNRLLRCDKTCNGIQLILLIGILMFTRRNSPDWK